MLYKVGFRSANLLKVSLVTTAAMLAICLLALVETTDAAEAASLPQNGKIAFTSFDVQDKDYGIYTVDPDGSSLSKLTNNIEPGQPAWSPDGTKIAFGSEDSIRVMGAYGPNLRRLTSHKLEVFEPGPSWLPDGTTLAFSMDSDPSEFGNDLYTMDVDGSNKTRLTNSPKIHEGSIDISPDGSQMCLNRESVRPLSRGIYLMNVDASNLTRLTTERDNAHECSWSPDGTKIAYHVVPSGLAGPDLTEAEVYIMNADGSGKTKLTNTPEGSWFPEWSPDGTRIAFSSKRDGDYDIYTMDADGSDVTQVTNLPGDESYPGWLPLTHKSRSMTVHPPDTGGPSLLLVASALLFSGGVMFYAGVRRRM